MVLLFVFQVNVQVLANRILMKCKMQSGFLKYHLIVRIFLGFVKLSIVMTENVSKLSGF